MGSKCPALLSSRLEGFRKGEDQRGLRRFYTRAQNFGSKKLKENDASPASALVYFFMLLHP